ncbi:MAG: glycoside hydrolase family 3 protein [Proteobacteria bacterium]|nr:glycoside hydrolase family 3 protein [Pseudomonadota bacterium]
MLSGAKLSPIIFGCTGLTLDADEKAFFKDASPAGFILFKKNCDNPVQVSALVNDLRSSVGWHAPVLIDQEGGRVQRLRPPHWPDFPPPRTYGQSTETLNACVRGLADVQVGMGIDVNCIPVLDVVPDDNKVMAINDRSFGSDAKLVATRGIETCQTAIACGVTPVMKHMPGHGRAVVDSHFELPRVSASHEVLSHSDFLPFKEVAKAIDNNTIWGMTAHVIYTQLDPELPATLSPTIIQNIIRAEIGFEGLLLTDDLFMDALKPWGDVATRSALAVKAGCDLALHCHGTVPERAKTMETLPPMREDTQKRLQSWQATR